MGQCSSSAVRYDILTAHKKTVSHVYLLIAFIETTDWTIYNEYHPLMNSGLSIRSDINSLLCALTLSDTMNSSTLWEDCVEPLPLKIRSHDCGIC